MYLILEKLSKTNKLVFYFYVYDDFTRKIKYKFFYFIHVL